jgi:hypothetical protein
MKRQKKKRRESCGQEQVLARTLDQRRPAIAWHARQLGLGSLQALPYTIGPAKIVWSAR